MFSPCCIFPKTAIAKYNHFLKTLARLPTLSHSIALSKLGRYSLGGWRTNWTVRLRRLTGRTLLGGLWQTCYRDTYWTYPFQHLCQWLGVDDRVQAHQVSKRETQGLTREQEQMQNPAAGKEEPGVMMQAGGWLAGEQLCWKRPGSPGRQKAGHEPAACPGSKGGQRRPGLYKPRQSQQIEGSALHLWDCIWILSPVLGPSIQERRW